MSANRAFRSGIIGALATLLITGGCARKHSGPVDVKLDPDEIPPIPTDLALALASGSVSLTWSVSDPTGVTYNVYRARGSGSFAYLASSSVPSYVDTGVVNGTKYAYQVAGVKGEIEGERSPTVSGVPNVFALVLESGASATSGQGNRTIRVDLVAPTTTETYRLSEDPGLAGATPRRFDPGAATTTFVLSPNDGPKVLYCAFDLPEGTVSEIVSSTIVLDTRALITQVTEDSGGNTLSVNDVLHLTLTADSPGGTATVDIGSAHRSVELFDDGTNGDATAFDGVYERDYVITAGGEVVQEPVAGSFRDEVGNVANPVNSATTVTVSEPPPPVAFNASATRVLGSSVKLTWSESDAPDFGEYRLYRSAPDSSASVDENDALVVQITNPTSRSYTDTNLVAGAEYRWGIVVLDENGFRSTFDTAVVTALYDPQISGPTLSPVSGVPTTMFTYGCVYSHPLGHAPSDLALVVDGLVTYPMTQVGAGTNWVGGESFTVDLALGLGSHTFHFEATATDGSRTVAPVAGVFGGPVVTQ